jgi:hypothetical protein
MRVRHSCFRDVLLGFSVVIHKRGNKRCLRLLTLFLSLSKSNLPKKFDSIFFLVFFFTVFVLVSLLENNLSAGGDGFVEIVA